MRPGELPADFWSLAGTAANEEAMQLTRPARIGIGLLLVVVAVVLINRWQIERQYAELQSLVGTNSDPLVFMARSVTKGMNRQEVRSIVRGYKRLEILPPLAANDGGTEVFHFEFGLPILRGVDGYGDIVVSYDANGRVKEQAIADLN